MCSPDRNHPIHPLTDDVFSGGLLTFLVFVKGNLAHKKFLADVVKNRHGVWLLQPDGKGQSGERLV